MRDDSITIAKAIAILLMVLGHTYFSQYGNQWINMFHMPLFFFFAGFCMKDKYLQTPRVFVRKRVVGLYKPFVKWGIVFLLLHNVFFYVNIYNGEYGFRGNVSHLYVWQEYASHFVHIVTRMSDNEQLLGGYWFLKSLFVGSIIGYIVIKKIKSRLFGGGSLLCMTILLAFLHKEMPYFGVGAREVLAAEFYVIGYYYRKSECKIHEKWYVLPFGLVVVTFGTHFYQATLLSFKWWQVIPYGATAIIGTLMVFYVSKVIVKQQTVANKWLVFIGNNTLTILTWHMLSFKIVNLMIIYAYSLPIARLAEFPVIEEYSQRGWFLLYFFIGVIVPMGMTKIKILK